MLTHDEIEQIRTVVREEVGEVEKRLGRALNEQGNMLLEAIEINGKEQMTLEKRVARIEQHLHLPPVK